MFLEYNKDQTKFLFSVVIPAHGRIEYLKETMLCLDKQVFRGFEVIVSDDSEAEEERAIICRLVKEFANRNALHVIYLFTESSLGQSKNTSQGLKHVSGEWVRILHSDDLVHPELFAYEYQIIQNLDEKAICAINEKNISFSDASEITEPKRGGIPYIRTPQFIIKNSLHSECPIPSGLLFKKAVYEAIGGFNSDYIRACDWEFYSRIIRYAMEHGLQAIEVTPKYVFWRDAKESNHNKIGTLFVNFYEYEAISSFNIETMMRNGFTQNDIADFNDKAIKYRYSRCRKDFGRLSFFYKVRCASSYYSIVLKGIFKRETGWLLLDKISNLKEASKLRLIRTIETIIPAYKVARENRVLLRTVLDDITIISRKADTVAWYTTKLRNSFIHELFIKQLVDSNREKDCTCTNYLEMLNEFSAICKREKIAYWLDKNSLVGYLTGAFEKMVKSLGVIEIGMIEVDTLKLLELLSNDDCWQITCDTNSSRLGVEIHIQKKGYCEYLRVATYNFAGIPCCNEDNLLSELRSALNGYAAELTELKKNKMLYNKHSVDTVKALIERQYYYLPVTIKNEYLYESMWNISSSDSMALVPYDSMFPLNNIEDKIELKIPSYAWRVVELQMKCGV